MLEDGRCSRREEASSNPVATIEDIQRRLIRPSPSPITTYIASQNHGDLEAKRRKWNTNTPTKLEDYLDPVLLSAIRSQLKNNNNTGTRKTHQEEKDFKWPSDELITSFPLDSDPKKVSKMSHGAVNLKDDLIDDGDIFPIEEHDRHHHDEEEQVVAGSPFGRFEMSVSKFSNN